MSTAGPGSLRPTVFVVPLGLWMFMAVVAVVNGIVRETIIVPLALLVSPLLFGWLLSG